jgi:hypothetical protein
MENDMSSFSALSSEESTIQTMLLSAAPEGLKRLAEIGKDPAPRFHFSILELADIAYGRNIETHEERLGDGTYLIDLLPCLAWWGDVTRALALGNSDEGEYGDTRFGFEEKRAVHLKLLNDVLSSYAAALAESPYYAGYGSSSRPAGLELMRRYREYVCEIGGFALEVWPGVDFGWLYRWS